MTLHPRDAAGELLLDGLLALIGLAGFADSMGSNLRPFNLVTAAAGRLPHHTGQIRRNIVHDPTAAAYKVYMLIADVLIHCALLAD